VKTTTTKVKVLELKEKAKSKAQQRFFGMVRAAQKGEMENPSSEVLDAADSMKVDDVKKFAKTKHKGLPEKKEVKEEPERTAAYKAMHKKLYPRGSTIDAKTGKDNAIMGNVGGFSNAKNRGKKRKVMAEFEPELEMVEAVKGQDTLSRKEGAKERATEKKAHDAWKKSGVGKTKRPLYSTTRHTKGDAESYATQQKQSIKWHDKRTKGKFIPGEQPIGEELTGDLKTDAEKYRVPRGPGGNPIRMGDKVRSMKGDHPLGKLKVKYGADKVREYYKKNKAVGESAVLDVTDKKKKRKEAELRRLLKHAIAVKRGQAESFEIDKSAHKKAQRQSKIRNLAKDNKNPNEKAAAERKLKGPKLAWEEFKKHI